MYNQKFVACVKNQGQVLREDGESVYIPFGSEYSILLKNLNSVRALASVSIDGTSATENVELIVPANGDIELERYIKGGNLQAGNRFKFIERTESIEQHRGVKAEDGLIRIEFRFEKVWTYQPQPYSSFGNGFITSNSVYGCNSEMMQNSGNAVLRGIKSSKSSADVQCSTSFQHDLAPVNEAGITVPGSISEQQFQQGAHFQTEAQSHVIVLRLVGDVGQRPVTKPVYVSTKHVCGTCGRNNKSNAKFCSNCGTSLQIV